MARNSFLGQYDIVIDDKGRVRVPAKYRAQLGDEFVIACESGVCLSVYPMESWDKLCESIEALPALDERTIDFKRTVYPNATWGEFDSAGRVLIPVKFRNNAELTKELVAAGVNDHFELWNAKNWGKEEFSTFERRRKAQKSIAEESGGGKTK